MDWTFEALTILVFLIPGFATSKILNVLLVRDQKTVFEATVEALIFSLVIYIIYSLWYPTMPVSFEQVGDQLYYRFDKVSFLTLGLLGVAAPAVLAAVLSYITTRDLHMKLARRIGLSQKTSRSSIWFDAFCDFKSYIIVNFSNGRRLCGWPLYYSDNPGSPYLFLSNPAWVETDVSSGESRFVNLDVDGILVTPEQKIESIEFLKKQTK